MIKGWISIRWSKGTNADFFWAGFDPNSVINSFHYDMHCTQTGELPSDSCISPTGPIAERVNDFKLEAEGFDIFSDTSRSIVNCIILFFNGNIFCILFFIVFLAIHRFERLQDTSDVAQDVPIPVVLIFFSTILLI